MSKKIVIIYAVVLLIAGTGAVLFINRNLANNFQAGAISNSNAVTDVAATKKESDLSFAASGKVVSISKQVGDEVTAGEVLATVDNAGIRAQYSQAQAGVAAAQSELASLNNTLKVEKLGLKDLTSTAKKIQQQQVKLAQNNIDAQNAKIQQAEDGLKNIQSQLDEYVIKAPFDGLITRQNLELGEVATPGIPVITLEAK